MFFTGFEATVVPPTHLEGEGEEKSIQLVATGATSLPDTIKSSTLIYKYIFFELKLYLLFFNATNDKVSPTSLFFYVSTAAY